MILKIASICVAIWILFGLVTFLFMTGGCHAADEKLLKSWGPVLFIGKLIHCLIAWPAVAMSFTFIGAWAYVRGNRDLDKGSLEIA